MPRCRRPAASRDPDGDIQITHLYLQGKISPLWTFLYRKRRPCLRFFRLNSTIFIISNDRHKKIHRQVHFINDIIAQGF